jgi:hypothetical protein
MGWYRFPTKSLKPCQRRFSLLAQRRSSIGQDSLLAEVRHLTGRCIWAISICIKHKYDNESYFCSGIITTSILALTSNSWYIDHVMSSTTDISPANTISRASWSLHVILDEQSFQPMHQGQVPYWNYVSTLHLGPAEHTDKWYIVGNRVATTFLAEWTLQQVRVIGDAVHGDTTGLLDKAFALIEI